MLDLIAYKNTHVPITNLVKDPYFSNFAENDLDWKRNSVDYAEVVDDTLKLKASARYGGVSTNIYEIYENSYYISGEIKAPLGNNNAMLYWSVLEDERYFTKEGTGNFERISVVGKARGILGGWGFGVRDFNDSDWSEFEFRRPLVINLTKTFGKGNEPTTEQMDKLLETRFENGWFDGTKNLFNAKEFMNVYHKKTKELENAIISLGGELP